MALEVNIPELDNQFLDKAQITHNNLFIFPEEEEISTGDLLSVIDYHKLHIRARYLTDRKYYEGDHKINHQAPKEPFKPDNRLVINFPRKAITSFNGFFIGTPVKIDSKDKLVDEFVSNWMNVNSFEDVDSEVAKMASIYGRAYYFVYQDEDSQTCVTPMDPLNTFLIYDDTIAHNVKYGVNYRFNSKGEMVVLLIDAKIQRTLVVNSSSNNYMDQVGVTANPYPIVPIVEGMENEERLSLCHDIVSLIDALDRAMSEKANDVDYFADAYLKIVNAYFDEKTVGKFQKHLRDQRMVVINGDGGEDGGGTADAGFMEKPNADTTQENLVNRLVDYIYQIANVTNMNDEAFAGNPSGVTLKLKYQPMKDMADVKAQKFKKSLRNVFKCVFAAQTNIQDDAWQDLQFRFTQSVPQNLLELSQAFTNFYGKISNKTLFRQMPFIDDPDKEMEQIKQENADNQQQVAQVVNNALTDQQKGGVTDANNGQATAPKDSTTDKSGQPDRPTK